ncbi:MAG: glycosyltransferase family 4 protein [Planctomycetes bacterium]|nr:glycosyltransferase family 4 protein [Planctomycetota bacterium]
MAHVRFLYPSRSSALGGNASTAERLADALRGRGHSCSVHSIARDVEIDEVLRGGLEEDDPPADILVALHAVDCAPVTQRAATEASLPWIIVFPGTDLNGKPSRAAVTAVAEAHAAIALAPHARKRAAEIYGRERIEVLPQAARALPEPRGGAPLPPRAPKLPSNAFLIVQPTGIRSVKAPCVGIEALASLAEEEPRLRLWIAGPELEQDEAMRLRETLATYPWAAWLGALEKVELAGAVRRANLVLSTSRSEGAAPNSLLEAALYSKPLLASDIPAHRFFPGPGHLFRAARDLRREVRAQIEEPAKAALAGRQLHEVTRTKFDRMREAVAWDRLIARVLG